MDWTALRLSALLGLCTLAILLPVAVWLGRSLALRRFPGRAVVEAAVALPLVLPPTVIGFYLLVAFGGRSPLGQGWQAVFGHGLAFSFEGLLLASVLVNLPFAVQPVQNAFAAVPKELREAGAVSGMSPWSVLLRVELPLAWPGIATAAVLSFAHTLGEFGVVLMVGGSIPGETRTVAIAIYDRVQAFDEGAAAAMSAVLLGVSMVALGLTSILSRRVGRRTVDA
ncbi:molybdate ABC transporter permease subunit [Roseomonas xinghualingensis]|uniref:molybdate ABC transporter permease subunit n=1 Tax=Roseomonas xinghualingensis TaxID=2986475 RepID=UPI0021F1DBED|nr:molybdate ABC transporter permease subunit [Roseomonas sp. SXEYE001]